MRIAIVDACRPLSRQTGFGLGARYLQWELHRRGINESSAINAEVVLISVVDARQCNVVRTMRQRNKKAIIVVGGAGAINPFSLGRYADMVCLGDGQQFMKVLLEDGPSRAYCLPNVWRHNDTTPVEIDHNFPWHMPPMMGEDGAVRVWCGRGCRKKCRFCATGWSYSYAENPHPNTLIAQAEGLLRRGFKINYISNDIGQHSFAKSLPPVGHLSLSVDFIRRNGIPEARQIRLGIEGVSERLRNAIGKPLSMSELVDLTSWLNRNGKSVRWFLVIGLPGEEANDWDELRDTISLWKHKTPKGVLGLSFTAFLPEPSTPLGIMPLEEKYWNHWTKFKTDFFEGPLWSHRVKLMAPAKPSTRMQTAMMYMGLPKLQLLAGGDWGPNNRVEYPFKLARERLAVLYASQMGVRYLDFTGDEPRLADG